MPREEETFIRTDVGKGLQTKDGVFIVVSPGGKIVDQGGGGSKIGTKPKPKPEKEKPVKHHPREHGEKRPKNENASSRPRKPKERDRRPK